MVLIDPVTLSKALQSVNPEVAALTNDARTTITAYPAPFLRRYAIYSVLHKNPHHPVMFFVAYAPGRSAYLLTDAPDDFVQMARADGVRIDTPETAVAYANAYIDTTRGMDKLFYRIGAAAEARFRPELDDEETRAKEEFLRQYESALKPSNAVAATSGFDVTVYAIREQALERHVLSVAHDGQTSDEVTVLAEDLPLVYGA